MSDSHDPGASDLGPEPDETPPLPAQQPPPPRKVTARSFGDSTPGAAPEPLAVSELIQATWRPDLLAAHVLGSPERIARNLADGRGIAVLALVLFGASVAAALPFGGVAPVGDWWSVAALFAGSVLICLPCLYAFLQFTGLKLTFDRTVTIALLIPATAGLLSLAFAPIVWFIDATTARVPYPTELVDAAGNALVVRAGETAGDVTPVALARVLLGLALLLGVVQLGRVTFKGSSGDTYARTGTRFLLLLWLPLLLFIVRRMSSQLGIWE